MLRRDLIIAILVTFFLTSILFTMIPVSSSPAIGSYDPWADINDDGKIDGYDIAYGCRLFGTSGDPAKPVVIEGYNYKVIAYNVTIAAYSGGNINITTAGYKQITLYFMLEPVLYVLPSFSFYYNITVATAFIINHMHGCARARTQKNLVLIRSYFVSNV